MSNSKLFYRINTNKDTVKCVFVFFVSFTNWKIEINTFDLNEIPMNKIIELHDKIAQDWTDKYK